MAEEAARLTSPRISIIVPVYKVEQYLRRCLDSIAAQTFTDWECILIDDGSPDSSGAICDEYAARDSRFRVIHQENRGVSAARNEGLDAARGEWIGFVDSDDWIEVDYFLHLVGSAIENKADIILGSICLTDGEKQICNYSSKTGWLSMPKDFAWYRQGSWAKLIKKSILHKNNIKFPVGITLAEDLFFTFQIFFYTSSIYGLAASVYYYYQNPHSCTHTISEQKINDEISVIKKIEQILIENNASKEWFDYLTLKKNVTKSYCLFSFEPPRIDLYRKIFPEVNRNFSGDSKKLTLFKILIILHLDSICRFILFVRKICLNWRGSLVCLISFFQKMRGNHCLHSN